MLLKNISIKVMLFISITFLLSCQNDKKDDDSSDNVLTATVLCYNEFDAAVLNITKNDMDKAGFDYGDNVDIFIDNELCYSNVPYFDGYYNNRGEFLICIYQSSGNAEFTANCVGARSETKISENVKLTIKLNTKGGSLDIQKAMGMTYSDNRDEYSSDIVFANARQIAVGNITDNKLYRSASPFDNTHNRAPFASAFAEQNGINCVVDLADNEERMSSYGALPSYSQYLVDNGKVIYAKVNADYQGDNYNKVLVSALAQMAHADAPYLVHCLEGKDRTGYVCALLEALCGASWQEITVDYMITYSNYFNVDLSNNPSTYNLFVQSRLEPVFVYYCNLNSPSDIINADLQNGVEAFLMSKGMAQSDIELLKLKLTE